MISSSYLNFGWRGRWLQWRNRVLASQRFQRFRARVERVVEGPSTCVDGGVRLGIELDDAPQPGWPVELRAGAAPAPVVLALAGVHRLKLHLDLAGASEKCGWIVLRDVELE